jgi:hypothetical protein
MLSICEIDTYIAKDLRPGSQWKLMEVYGSHFGGLSLRQHHDARAGGPRINRR